MEYAELREDFRKKGLRTLPLLDIALCAYSAILERGRPASRREVSRRSRERILVSGSYVLYAERAKRKKGELMNLALEFLVQRGFVDFDGSKYRAVES